MTDAATVKAAVRDATLSDEALVRRVAAGDRALFEVLMRRHNPRVYRTIRSILRDEGEVEDAMQQTYLLAYAHLAEFSGASAFGTWLTRIALNEALGRVRRRAHLVAVTTLDGSEDAVKGPGQDPEEGAARHEAGRLLERCIDGLSEDHRTVVMLRDVEGLTTAEVAEVLGVSDEAVRVRLHRARRALREAVSDEVGRSAIQAFPFEAPRCDRVVAGVFAALGPRPRAG